MKKLITLLLLLSGASFGEIIITDKGDDFAIILPRTATSAQLTAETARATAAEALKVDITDGVATNLTVANVFNLSTNGTAEARFVISTDSITLQLWNGTAWVNKQKWED